MIEKTIGSTSGLNVVIVKPKKEIIIEIIPNSLSNEHKKFRLSNKINYFFIVNSKDDSGITINLERAYKQIVEERDESDVVDYITSFSYGNPNYKCAHKYEIVYSFDSNYFHGAFTSLRSLIENFNQKLLWQMKLNLCVPEVDFNLIDKELKRFISLNPNNPDYTLILTINALADEAFTNTKCYKGGNHLLKLSNFSRLIVGHVINSTKLLYLDSDTIIQSDMAQLLDSVPPKNKVAFMGKRAKLNYNNLINVNNKDRALEFLGKDFNLGQNVIYTGTMILNTPMIKKRFNRMIELVKKHNETPNGIYKLFTMSVINLGMADSIGYFDDYIKNVVDLGFKADLEEEIESSDVLDWSGMFKPWFRNGLYQEYFMKYNVMYSENERHVMYNKDTVESKLS